MSAALSRRTCLAALLSGCSLPALLRAAEAGPRGDVPWLDEVQTPPGALPADAPALRDLLVDDAGWTIATREAWEGERQQLKKLWLEFLGPVEVPRAGPPPLEVVEEDRRDGVLRQLVRYEAEPGLSVEAYLLKPLDLAGRRPGVAVFHSTTGETIRQPAGLAGEPEKAFGLTLARRGYVAFCPRCFLWSRDRSIGYQEHVARFQQRHPGAKGMAKMLADARLAVDLLVAQPEVDPQRIGAVGHSLGAKEVLYLAAFDERVAVTVSSEGGIGRAFSNWEAPWYLGETVQPGFPREHHELLALAAPRAFLLLGGDSADGQRSWPFIAAALPVYRLYGGRPRLGLFNHRQGHAVPPAAEARIAEWFETYL